jgi:hypothetical protein
MARNSRPWSAAEDATLQSLLDAGISLQRVAIRLKRTRRAVEVRRALLNKQRPGGAPSQPAPAK